MEVVFLLLVDEHIPKEIGLNFGAGSKNILNTS